MGINLQLPKLAELTPRITVVGVGGAGGNAINNMISQGLKGVEFIVANTDAQALAQSSAEYRIQLGAALTEGLGAGARPEIGQAAAEEALTEIRQAIAGSHMVFIAAGMGGGTGTGAASIIARTAKEEGILTVGVVTKPFKFEGERRMRSAEAGIEDLRQHVDTLIVIPNQNLFRIANEKTTFADAFILADQVLHSGIACVTDLVVREGIINLDFADVRTVLSGMGQAMMGTGEASGEDRAKEAAELAINNPLLDDISLSGAKGLLVSISGDRGLTLLEVDAAANAVRQEVDPDATIIVGATFDDSLKGRIRVSVVASGLVTGDNTGWQQPPSREPRRDERPPGPANRRPAAAPSDDTAHRPPYLQAPLADRLAQSRTAMAEQDRHPPQPFGSGQLAEPGMRPPRPLPPLPSEDPFVTGASERGYEGYGPQPEPASHELRVAPPPPTGLSPGDGVIELGSPRYGQQQPEHRGLPPAPEPFASPIDPPAGAGPIQFEPLPPGGSRRPPARIPELEEFPEVGQRAYRSKHSPQEPSGGKGLGGFLSRWTGLGRAADSESDPDNVTESETNDTESGRARTRSHPADTARGTSIRPSGATGESGNAAKKMRSR